MPDIKIRNKIYLGVDTIHLPTPDGKLVDFISRTQYADGIETDILLGNKVYERVNKLYFYDLNGKPVLFMSNLNNLIPDPPIVFQSPAILDNRVQFTLNGVLYIKVSDTVLTQDELLGLTITVTNANGVYKLNCESSTKYSYVINGRYTDGTNCIDLYSVSKPHSLFGARFPEAGLYVSSADFIDPTGKTAAEFALTYSVIVEEMPVFNSDVWAHLNLNTLYLSRANSFARNDATLEVLHE